LNVLLDTHFLLWAVLDLPRMDEFPWLDRYRPWGVSPVSLLEVQFLAEVGRLEVEQPAFTDAVSRDPRFVVDEVPLVALVRHALSLTWTRDPFDRLIAAHSGARRVPLCTLNRRMLEQHRLLVPELVDPLSDDA
jgi:PIN domain nuclease of toxin-antitoxin system